MILSHPTFENMIELEENKITVLAVENPVQLSSYLYEFKSQINGYDGGFSLFEDNEEIPLSAVDLIIDPFNLDLNSKEIINGVSYKIKSILNSEEYYLSTQELFSEISKFSFQVLGEIDYDLIGSEINIPSIIKLISPHYDNCNKNVLENVCQYLHISSKFTKTRIFSFVNLKTFLSHSQIEQLFKYVMYEKIQLFLFESSPYEHSEYLNETIIDSDLCEITLK
ncbi:type II-A CRISPR-associated protein Csn2 [Methanomethylophilus alvi]|uniref:type II-A CRISPR-associated protein Csn2 n=1 Tax=Methanomethylophilus alvi TaxID=1291540 RepID=UPI0037DDBEDE